MLIKQGRIKMEEGSECTFQNIKSLFIELPGFQKTKNKIIGIIYRPPNNQYNKFEEHLTKTFVKSE